MKDDLSFGEAALKKLHDAEERADDIISALDGVEKKLDGALNANFAKVSDMKKSYEATVTDFDTTELRTFLIDCRLCGAEFKIECYGNGSCPACGQEHEYDEGHGIVLDDDQKAMLLGRGKYKPNEHITFGRDPDK